MTGFPVRNACSLKLARGSVAALITMASAQKRSACPRSVCSASNRMFPAMRDKAFHRVDIGAHFAIIGNAHGAILKRHLHHGRQTFFQRSGELHRLDNRAVALHQMFGQHHADARLIDAHAANGGSL